MTTGAVAAGDTLFCFRFCLMVSKKIHKIQKERVFDNNLVVYYTQEKEIKDQSRAYLALMQVTALSNLISIQVNSEPTYQP